MVDSRGPLVMQIRICKEHWGCLLRRRVDTRMTVISVLVT